MADIDTQGFAQACYQREWLYSLKRVKNRQGNSVIVIAEAHNIGSEEKGMSMSDQPTKLTRLQCRAD